MDARRIAAAIAMLVPFGLMLLSGGSALAQHEGHNHGEPEGPALSLEDLAPRASTVGALFQMVALPKEGQLVIFLDSAETNAPMAGARIEILAGDALVTAEEAAPGLYVVSPWPAEGITAEEAEYVELIATVVAGDREEVLLARMQGDAHGHEGHDHSVHGPEPAKAGTARVALWDGVRPLALPVTAGLLALLGAIAGFRSTGVRRWIGLSVSGVGIVTMIAATGLV